MTEKSTASCDYHDEKKDWKAPDRRWCCGDLKKIITITIHITIKIFRVIYTIMSKDISNLIKFKIWLSNIGHNLLSTLTFWVNQKLKITKRLSTDLIKEFPKHKWDLPTFILLVVEQRHILRDNFKHPNT